MADDLDDADSKRLEADGSSADATGTALARHLTSSARAQLSAVGRSAGPEVLQDRHLEPPGKVDLVVASTFLGIFLLRT